LTCNSPIKNKKIWKDKKNWLCKKEKEKETRVGKSEKSDEQR